MKGPWNLGVKVKDLDSDLAFLEACGATQIQKGTIPLPEGDAPFGMAFLGPQRLLLFPHVIYEDALAEPLKSGLTHVVYEVDDVAEVLQRFKRRGVVPMWGPEDLSTPFGRRRVVFFRSPSGLIFETFQNLA
jgi:catechol 2,3-dioxygenase-like lactoylglutathione lyase family enzyme